MKRPIAEFTMMTVSAGSETERGQVDRAMWQILRRKQGYVTHRLYEHVERPSQRLMYSEWESAKALDGARQHMQSTPLMRRARATPKAASQRLIFEIIGPLTSTKGLALPADAVAAVAVGRLKVSPDVWRERERAYWAALAGQAGHITHLVLHGLDDPLAVGSLSHWGTAAQLHAALAQLDERLAGEVNGALVSPLEYEIYRLVRD